MSTVGTGVVVVKSPSVSDLSPKGVSGNIDGSNSTFPSANSMPSIPTPLNFGSVREMSPEDGKNDLFTKVVATFQPNSQVQSRESLSLNRALNKVVSAIGRNTMPADFSLRAIGDSSKEVTDRFRLIWLLQKIWPEKFEVERGNLKDYSSVHELYNEKCEHFGLPRERDLKSTRAYIDNVRELCGVVDQ